MLEAEMHITREAGTFHYSWFCNLAVDFNRSKETNKAFFVPEFSNAILSAREIGEIRNQINYMLDAEDDADEEFFEDYQDLFDEDFEDYAETYCEDPFADDCDDPFAATDM